MAVRAVITGAVLALKVYVANAGWMPEQAYSVRL